VECHPGAVSRERAGWPGAAECQKCHTAETALTPMMKQVADWPATARPYPKQRLYQTRDFVVFSHQSHRAVKQGCAACHGEVYSMEPLQRHREVTMAACVDCHKEARAPLDCNLCHDLGQ